MGRPEDKRDTERIQILGELNGEITIFQPMAIREISRGGVKIEIAFPLQLGSLHELRLTLGHRSVVVKGRVAHCSVTDVEHELVIYMAGIEYVEPSERVANVIDDFIAAIRAGRQAL